MYDERTRGVKLRLLDLSIPKAQIADLPDTHGKDVQVGFEPYAVAEADDQLYVICHEGVGWKVDDDHPLRVELYVSEPDHIAIVPSYVAKLTPAEVRAFTTDEEVDLADHVRKFGARLEGNFWTWHRQLSGVRA